MTAQADEQAKLRQLLAGRRNLLLDFDGPVCSVYAGMPAAEVAEKLRQRLWTELQLWPRPGDDRDDPLELIQDVGLVALGMTEAADRILTRLEIRAIQTAQPTPDADRLISTAKATKRTVTIVSNNSGDAVNAYLSEHRLAAKISHVIGRDTDPTRMKPDPYLIQFALRVLDADQDECVFVGDSDADVDAGRRAGVPVIGFASRDGKAQRLAAAGADAVVTQLAGIAQALRDTRSSLGGVAPGPRPALEME